MYNDSFGLKRNPFRMTADTAFLYLTPRHREALAGLTYAILDRKGLVVVIGGAGTGKTTLLTRFLETIPDNWLRPAVILNPTLTCSEFLETLLLSFGMEDVAGKPRRLMALEKFFRDANKEGKTCALLIDEAHKVSLEVLEEIRLLGNLEENGQKLLQIVLLGQSDLGDVLNRPEMSQLKQRMALRFTITPLSEIEIGEYVRHRWQKAGATQPLPLTEGALSAIGECSRGIPRTINGICDNVLMLAFAEGDRIITERHIHSVCMDLDLPIPTNDTISDHNNLLPPAVNGSLKNGASHERNGNATVSLPVNASSIRTREGDEKEVVQKPLLRRWMRKVGLVG